MGELGSGMGDVENYQLKFRVDCIKISSTE